MVRAASMEILISLDPSAISDIKRIRSWSHRIRQSQLFLKWNQCHYYLDPLPESL